MSAGIKHEEDEVAWLIERDTGAGRPLYFCGNHWSYDSLDAVRFCRKQDAEAVRANVELVRESPTKACEHMWHMPPDSERLNCHACGVICPGGRFLVGDQRLCLACANLPKEQRR